MYVHFFPEAIEYARDQLVRYGQDINPGRWQGYDTKGKPDLVTRELLNLQLEVPVFRNADEDPLDYLQEEIKPNLPWADDHFAERVSRDPSNPGEQYKNWPWWLGQADTTQEHGLFSHTYQERFWPKKAGDGFWNSLGSKTDGAYGIRYDYGDLDDVVDLLVREPLTRQATFPIFFPEDTGAVHGGRVPCTLHYHFMVRNSMLHLWYPIRSCDYVRHFRDDLYMACRLMLWVIEECDKKCADETWHDIIPGHLYFTAYSFHYHYGDHRYV